MSTAKEKCSMSIFQLYHSQLKTAEDRSRKKNWEIFDDKDYQEETGIKKGKFSFDNLYSCLFISGTFANQKSINTLKEEENFNRIVERSHNS